MMQDKGSANLQSCPWLGEKDESLQFHKNQSFSVDCLRKGQDMTAEGHLPAAFPPQTAGVISPSLSKSILLVHCSSHHRNSL